MRKCRVELGIAHNDVNADDKLFKDFDHELDISFLVQTCNLLQTYQDSFHLTRATSMM